MGLIKILWWKNCLIKSNWMLIQRRRFQTSTSQSTKSVSLPREKHRFGASSNPPRLPTFLQPSRTPAPAMYFATKSKSLHLPREKHFQPPTTCRNRQFLTILTSKSISLGGVVQILRSSISKSAPNPWCFNDFDFQIGLARRRGAKCLQDTASFWRFWCSGRSHAEAWCKFCWNLDQPILRNSRFSELSLRAL